jgi:hypothetical protein
MTFLYRFPIEKHIMSTSQSTMNISTPAPSLSLAHTGNIANGQHLLNVLDLQYDLQERRLNDHGQPRRLLVDYDERTNKIMEMKSFGFNNNMNLMALEHGINIYPNMYKTASEIIQLGFQDRRVLITMVLAKTQSGKTGTMCATIKFFLENKGCLKIPLENIYIITGCSSIEWVNQTSERMPLELSDRIFHRNKLPKSFAKEIKGKKNVLIIMDEIQVASKVDQTISKAFEEAGLFDEKALYDNDIKIVEFTATPDGAIYDLQKWDKSATVTIIAEPGDGYVSAGDLLKAGRVKQYKDLCGYDKGTFRVSEQKRNAVFANIREVKMDVDHYAKPSYHIIRTNNGPQQGVTISNFENVFGKEDFIFTTFDMESDKDDINDILTIRPKKHTFIFIKEMLRCSKTIHKKYMGVSYERFTSSTADDAVINQGLVGRDTGYDNNGVSICYTNMESIEKYELLWESKFKDETIIWNSKSTKRVNGITVGKHTFNDPENYGSDSDSDSGIEKIEAVLSVFSTEEAAKKHILYNKLQTKGPNKRKQNSSGWYECTIRNSTKVHSFDEVNANKGWGLSAKFKCRSYACYDDKYDVDTLKWVVSHYPI